MPLVLDASVAASWAFPDEGQAQAALALDALRHDEAHVPSLWWFEIWNVLVVSERRRRIAEADTRAFLHALSRLAVTVDRSPDQSPLLALARRHQLTAYDAAYLELAQRRSIPLATLDATLAAAARLEGVALIGERPA